MTEHNDTGSSNLACQLLEARRSLKTHRSKIIRNLCHAKLTSSRLDIRGALILGFGDYVGLLTMVRTLETEIEQQSSHAPKGITGNAIDFDAARNEVLSRISKLCGRPNNESVSG